MQQEQLLSIVSEIQKYDQSFNLINYLSKKRDDLKYRDKISKSNDKSNILALMLEKYIYELYVEYKYDSELYIETKNENVVSMIKHLPINIVKEDVCYYRINIPTNNDFVTVLEKLDAFHIIKEINSCTYK